MSRVLAFVDESACADDVIATADALARLLSARVDVMHAAAESPERWRGTPRARHVAGQVGDLLAHSLDEEDVLIGVLGVRSGEQTSKPMGHVVEELCVNASKPIVVVPPGSGPPADPPIVVVPLDGTEATARSVTPVVERLQQGGAAIVSVHVFGHDSLPPLMSSAEDRRTVAAEFDALHLHGRSDSVEMGVGDVEDMVPDLVRRVGADAVVVGWGQSLKSGRAAVIRRLIESDVRIVLVPRAPEP